METIIFVFIITRFLFLANYPHFYDGPEYLKLSQEPSVFSALEKSHKSIHPIYLLLIQAGNKLYNFMNFKNFINSITPISFVSALFATFSIICFYYLIKRLFNQKTAFFSLIPLIFFPHLWLIQTNIAHETVDHFLVLGSFLFFDIFLTAKKFRYVLLTVFLLLLAVINFVGNIIWFPIFFGLLFFRKFKKRYDFN